MILRIKIRNAKSNRRYTINVNENSCHIQLTHIHIYIHNTFVWTHTRRTHQEWAHKLSKLFYHQISYDIKVFLDEIS